MKNKAIILMLSLLTSLTSFADGVGNNLVSKKESTKAYKALISDLPNGSVACIFTLPFSDYPTAWNVEKINSSVDGVVLALTSKFGADSGAAIIVNTIKTCPTTTTCGDDDYGKPIVVAPAYEASCVRAKLKAAKLALD